MPDNTGQGIVQKSDTPNKETNDSNIKSDNQSGKDNMEKTEVDNLKTTTDSIDSNKKDLNEEITLSEVGMDDLKPGGLQQQQQQRSDLITTMNSNPVMQQQDIVTAVSPPAKQNLQNDMKVGIAVYKIEDRGKVTVHHVVEGPGIENICDYMNGNGNTLQSNVPVWSAKSVQDPLSILNSAGDDILQQGENLLGNQTKDIQKALGKMDINNEALKNLTQAVTPESVESVKNSLTDIPGFDEKKATEAGNIANQFLQNIPKGGKSRTAKRRASTKHSSSSRRRSGKIKRKSRRLRRRRRQRQTKHRS